MTTAAQEFTPTIDEQPINDDTVSDISIKKPKRVFNTKEEQSRYIEGFRTKYKTEMCKNF